ncbi:M36 family metallopeptidase [Nocardioides sp.]|uniref:M36 family metallopeptidase n=1 Tax=Nocardioides sp. TaxID=35761 RepID=UPI002B267167|nr:M36 family metallopeptidase [Nocardioides sp.]
MISLTSRRGRYSAAIAALATATLVPGLLQMPAVADGVDIPSVPGLTRNDGVGERILPGSIGDPVAGLVDIDTRGSTVPSALQKSAAARLGATDLRWNAFGTPASVLPSDGVLARATSSNPVTAARNYLVSNAAAFGLSASDMRGLVMVNNQELAFDGGHAVFFRQSFDGLVPAIGSAVTVGVANGEIAYVSSSLTKTTQNPPASKLSAAQGWLLAAENVGLDLSDRLLDDVVRTVSDGWTRLRVPGLAQEQLVRLRALALADGSVRPVLEANVVDVAGGHSEAYTVLVDAVDGSILHRQNQVENLAEGLTDGPSTLSNAALGGGLAASNSVTPFTGTYTATACGPKHEFELTDDKTRSIVMVGSAVNPANDIVLKLYDPSGAVLASGDLLTSPETLTYSAAKIPAGTYSGAVCPFDGTALLPPAEYFLTIATSDQASGTPSPGAGGTAGNPRWRFFPANPTLDSPTQTPKNSVVACWFNANAKACTLPTGSVRNVSAPGPWDNVVATGLPTFTTIGNNANTHEAWASPLTPGGLAQAPFSPTQRYDAEFTDAWNNSQCSPTELVPGGNDIEFSVGNLFVTHNRMHDFSYYLGFNEGNYNLQVDNIGRGGIDGDPEVGNVQAGGQPSFLGRDNANQITLQDGVPGITNQYLFQPIAGAFYAPCTDGGLDMGIVGHEYTHAISNRMVGGPDEGLTSEQGGAMGESWSDQVAAEFQFEHGYSNGGNVWAVGAYATGNLTTAIRDYAMNKNPLNYANYGFDTTGPEVHADGEIWNGINWEVRQALVKKWNKKFPVTNMVLQERCAEGSQNKGPQRPALCPGNRRWLQLMFDSMLLQQGATSMLDARDAFIAADQMRFRGENKAVISAAFARRGMGKGSTVKDGDDTSPKPSFASAVGKNTKVVFKTKSGGSIYVGDFEARSTPVADTLGKTKKLGNKASFTAGRYDMLYVGPKHGFMRFKLNVTGKKSKQVVKVRTTKNLAAKKSGAKIIDATAGSLQEDFLIDGTEATSWGGFTATNVDESNPLVAVDLAGKKSKVRSVAVSAMLKATPGDADAGSRFTALRKFAVEACTKSCSSAKASWKRVFTSADNAFPSQRPRPVAPTLNMRAFAIKPTKAAALRLVVLENQCTGFAGYAGELDEDPINDTDCKTASDRGSIVHVAEFQAFTSKFPSWKSRYGIDNPQRSFR